MPVEEPTFIWLTVPFLVQFARMDAHFLAEKACVFRGQSGHCQRQSGRSGAAAANITAIGQLAKAGDGLPVQAHIAITPFGEKALS